MKKIVVVLAGLVLSGCKMTKNLTYTVDAIAPSETRCTYFLKGCCGNKTIIVDTCDKYKIGQPFGLVPNK